MRFISTKIMRMYVFRGYVSARYRNRSTFLTSIVAQIQKPTKLHRESKKTMNTYAFHTTCLVGLGAVVAAIAMCSPAFAQYTKYSDSGSFNAAASGLKTVNFEGLAATNGSTSYSLPNGLTLSGVNLTIDERGDLPTAGTNGTNGVLKVNGQGTTFSGVSVLSSQVPSYGSQNIDISLSSPVTAIGIDFADSSQAKLFGYVLFDESGDFQSIGSITPSTSGFSFFGITSSSPSASISEIVFSTNSTAPLYIKDLVSGVAGATSAASAPEPGSVALLLPLGALAAFGKIRRRSISRC